MKRIETTLSQLEYTAWQTFCRETGKNSTKILQEFVKKSIAHIRINADKHADKTLKSKRITVSFTQNEYDTIIEKVALEGYNNPTHWLRSLVMNILYQDAVLTDREIHALEKLSHQLWAIGHNLNQITRAININFNATDQLKLEMIQSLKNLNTETRDAFSALIRQNKNRWQKKETHKSKKS
jgi:Bacterial mobilisation protein (MobC)